MIPSSYPQELVLKLLVRYSSYERNRRGLSSPTKEMLTTPRRTQRLETLTVALWDYEAVSDFYCPIYSLPRVHNKATCARLSDMVILTDDYSKRCYYYNEIIERKWGLCQTPCAMSVTTSNATECLSVLFWDQYL